MATKQSSTVRRKGTVKTIQPRVKVWLERDDEYIFGWGLCEILQNVQAAGSIKEAAARLGKSYRYVWGRVKEGEETLGQSLVETRVGGVVEQRADLTPLATELVTEFAEFRRRLHAVVEQEFAERFAALKTKQAKR